TLAIWGLAEDQVRTRRAGGVQSLSISSSDPATSWSVSPTRSGNPSARQSTQGGPGGEHARSAGRTRALADGLHIISREIAGRLKLHSGSDPAPCPSPSADPGA